MGIEDRIEDLGLGRCDVRLLARMVFCWCIEKGPRFFFPRVGSAWALELGLAPWSRGPLVP